jgi:hypothetical protein
VRVEDIPKGRLARPVPASGVLDEAEARAAGADPGLTPLAQGRARVGAWLAAVDRLGPLTPLADPEFGGTTFILGDEVRGGAGGVRRLGRGLLQRGCCAQLGCADPAQAPTWHAPTPSPRPGP